MLEEREESEKGGALFTRDYGRMSSYYSNRTFLPEYKRDAVDIIPENRLNYAIFFFFKYKFKK